MASIENLDDGEILVLQTQRSSISTLYPVIAIDRPIPLTELELSWIDAFNVFVLDIVLRYPHRFERYLEKQLYETYRRRLFVFSMHTLAFKQYEIDKREFELQFNSRLELKRLMKRRQELSQIACSDGWDPRSYD